MKKQVVRHVPSYTLTLRKWSPMYTLVAHSHMIMIAWFHLPMLHGFSVVCRFPLTMSPDSLSIHSKPDACRHDPAPVRSRF